MNDKEPARPQQSVSRAIEGNKQYLNLQPYVTLAQHIMDAPVCEIHIMDAHYQRTVAHNIDKAVYKDIINYNAIRQNGTVYEVEDLANNRRYKDHAYVKNPPFFQYFCSANLTAKNGRDIGCIYVLDTKPKSVSTNQKKQLRHLARLAVNLIEYENRYREMVSKLEVLSDSLHKLNHDVRTPISGIMGISDLLIEKKDYIEFPARELTMIKESAETILNIIDGVLEASIIDDYVQEEQGKKRFGIIVEQLQHLFDPPSKAKGISLAFDSHVNTGLKVSQSFALKLLQITSNLLSNAIKFTPQNGAIDVTITRDSDNNNNILHITVVDNGQGMTADQIAAFNNGDAVARSAGTNGEQSFGVGLEHVKQAVAQAGGTISVQAGENNGTQFFVSLPIPVDNFGKLLSSLSLHKETKPSGNGVK
ncbi:ATP-binding protein [Halalkalibaculum sp. DA3122]|uniref:ATP-binding protein n=1 Tax=Halalkalibaculum sp. DA3122 TaxID=3373607 RepID=UPI00375529E8